MQIKGSKIAVVGGAGFIGSHLVDKLIEMEANVLVIDNLFLGKLSNIPMGKIYFKLFDASNFHRLEDILQWFNPDLIFNLAVVPLPHSLEQPFENIQINVKIVQNLCEIIRGGVCKKLIHFSSSEVYGSAQYEPMCENHPIGASTPYAASKAAGDLICMSYFRTFGSDISIIRPFNNYGPRQNSGSYAGVIPLTIERLMKGDSPVIFGDGHQTRDYIFVEDTVRAAIALAESDLKGEIFNVGSGHDIEILWLINEIIDLMHGQGYTTKKIQYQPARPGDVRRHISNCLKAKDKLGFEHRIGMEEGLEKTILWYLEREGDQDNV